MVVLREASTPRVEVSAFLMIGNTPPLVVNVEDVAFSFLRREREVLEKDFCCFSEPDPLGGLPRNLGGLPDWEVIFSENVAHSPVLYCSSVFVGQRPTLLDNHDNGTCMHVLAFGWKV